MSGCQARPSHSKGVSAYADDESNRWPSVHTLDQVVPFREIAEAIGRGLNLPTVGIARRRRKTTSGS